MAKLHKQEPTMQVDEVEKSPSVDQPIDIFEVDLEVFQGPFDLLLQLIARRQLDITEVALAEVTDEFIAHMERVPDLSTATEFLVVAATLLDMKAAQLLPQIDEDGQQIDEELSARDLLFSRLLQYRAYKEVAAEISERLDAQSLVYARVVPLEPQFVGLLPELVWNTSPEELARLALRAMEEKPAPDQAGHIARPGASLDEELKVVEHRLRSRKVLTFSELVGDAATSAVIVTRFLAVLELFRRRVIEFSQEKPLAPLIVSLVNEHYDNQQASNQDSTSQDISTQGE